MRKKIIVFIILAIIVISESFTWEGAAVTAPDGELPSTGRYVATNSFPRNTVVDITNIETNRSTRVIVANSLESPGLLAVVSREAAELIGMRPGSISRIRMSQPSDPIAYLRFTEGLSAGIPEYDSGNVITEENFHEEVVEPETVPVSSNVGAPGYLLETEWGGRRAGIVDLPEYFVSGDLPPSAIFDEPEEIAEYIPEEKAVEEVAVIIPVEEEAEEVAEHIPEEEVVEEVAEYIPEEEAVEEVAEYIPEEEVVEEVAVIIPVEEEVEEIAEYIPEEEVVEEVAEYIPEEEAVEEVAEYIPEEEVVEEVAVIIPVEEEVEEIPPVETSGEVAQYNIVPAQERPPSETGTIYGIDPADIIPGISAINPATARESAEPDASLSISMHEVEPIRQPTATVPEEQIVQSAPSTSPHSEVSMIPQEATLRAPSISELNRGAYYVQIAAVESLESAEKTIVMIDNNYGPVVYDDGSSWYRILLGPLNQGESAAILQRFKSIGYRDAFVRHVR